MHTYKAKIMHVIDGNTFEAVVDLGFKIYKKAVLKIYDIETADIFNPSCEAELKHGLETKKFIEEIALNKEVLIKISKEEDYIADVVLDVDRKGLPITLTNVLKENGFEKRLEY